MRSAAAATLLTLVTLGCGGSPGAADPPASSRSSSRSPSTRAVPSRTASARIASKMTWTRARCTLSSPSSAAASSTWRGPGIPFSSAARANPAPSPARRAATSDSSRALMSRSWSPA